MGDGRIEHGIGRAGDDVHVVPEAREFARDVGEVDALPAGLHRAVVHEEADSDGGGLRRRLRSATSYHLALAGSAR